MTVLLKFFSYALGFLAWFSGLIFDKYCAISPFLNCHFFLFIKSLFSFLLVNRILSSFFTSFYLYCLISFIHTLSRFWYVCLQFTLFDERELYAYMVCLIIFAHGFLCFIFCGLIIWFEREISKQPFKMLISAIWSWPQCHKRRFCSPVFHTILPWSYLQFFSMVSNYCV